MTPLEVLRQWERGDQAVWETEHMFGFDVMWGLVRDGRYVPQVIISRQVSLSEWEWALARKACAARDDGGYAVASSIIADLACGTTVSRRSRR